MLANVYLHYAFDLWVQHWRQHRATGEVIVVRYADDTVLGFQHRTDAEQFLLDWKAKTQTSVRGGAREMVEVRCTGILQLSCSSRESGQPSKFSVTGDPALDARATATQPEESDDLATTRSYRGALAPPT